MEAKELRESIADQGNWQVEVFFDNDCPLCRKEISLLRWLDRRKRIRFTDISAPEFDPHPLGKSLDLLMDEIHGRLPDGQWIVGVEVFRKIYSAIGLKILVWPTRLPLISQCLDLSYRWFAKNRLRLTGRCNDGQCKIAPNENKVTG